MVVFVVFMAVGGGGGVNFREILMSTLEASWKWRHENTRFECISGGILAKGPLTGWTA